MLDPSFVNAITGLGFSGAAVLAVWAYQTGKVRRGKEIEEARAEAAERLKEARDTANERLRESRKDRDEWKEIALTALNRLDRLVDVFEDITGQKPPQ